MQFETLIDLIQHIEENHIGEYHEMWPLSLVLLTHLVTL